MFQVVCGFVFKGFLTLDHTQLMRYLFGRRAHTVLERDVCMHCEPFLFRKPQSCLSILLREEGQASVPSSSVSLTEKRLRLWGSQIKELERSVTSLFSGWKKWESAPLMSSQEEQDITAEGEKGIWALSAALQYDLFSFLKFPSFPTSTLRLRGHGRILIWPASADISRQIMQMPRGCVSLDTCRSPLRWDVC